MTKKSFKFIIIALSLVFVSLVFTEYKSRWNESDSDDISQQSLIRISPSSLMLTLDDETLPFYIFELPITGLEDVSLESYDMILVNEDTVNGLENGASHLLHSGKIIYYSNPKITNEEIAQKLSIPKNYISVVNPYEKIATVIYKANHSIIFADMYQTNAIEDAEIPMDISLQNGLITGLKSALELREADDALQIVDLKMLNCYVGQSKKITMTIAHNTYPKGKWIVNGKQQDVWDAAGIATLNPVSSYAIGEYTVRMHVNIVGHTMLEFSDPGISTGRSFNPPNQTYFSSLGDDNSEVRDWFITPNSKIKGQAITIAPEIRATSANATGLRGSFTKLTYQYDKTTNWTLDAGSWF